MNEKPCDLELILLPALEQCQRCGWPSEDHPRWCHPDRLTLAHADTVEPATMEPDRLPRPMLFDREAGSWADDLSIALDAGAAPNRLRGIANALRAYALDLDATADALDRL